MKKCADMGIFGLMVPEEFGGTNMGIFASCLCGEEIARVHGGVSMVIGKAIYYYYFISVLPVN